MCVYMKYNHIYFFKEQNYVCSTLICTILSSLHYLHQICKKKNVTRSIFSTFKPFYLSYFVWRVGKCVCPWSLDDIYFNSLKVLKWPYNSFGEGSAESNNLTPIVLLHKSHESRGAFNSPNDYRRRTTAQSPRSDYNQSDTMIAPLVSTDWRRLLTGDRN